MTPSHVSLFFEPVCLVNLIIVKEVGPGSQHNSNFLRGAIAADKLHSITASVTTHCPMACHPTQPCTPSAAWQDFYRRWVSQECMMYFAVPGRYS